MQRYVLRRLLWFFPTLFLISLIGFYLGQLAPGDPVAILTGELEQDRNINETAYLNKRKELGLDKPFFYFSVASLSECDTLYKFARPEVRNCLGALTYATGNWAYVEKYYHLVKAFGNALYELKEGELEVLNRLKALHSQWSLYTKHEQVKKFIEDLGASVKLMPSLEPSFTKLHQHVSEWEVSQSLWKNYVPVVQWHGFNNQYHRWVLGAMRLDFGISYADGRPVSTKLGEALVWSIVINGLSVIVIYGLGIYMGVYVFSKRHAWQGRLWTAVLFVLYSLPSFWVGSMCILFLGGWLGWFPIAGVQSITHSSEWNIFSRIGDWAWHLVLPVFCMSYGSLAYLTKQMQTSLEQVFREDYIRTSLAKGLTYRAVLWKHAFKNGLFPILTLFAGIFPSLVGGSIIIETLFSLPGMGYLVYQALYMKDYPVMVAVFTLTGFMTVLGIFVVDLLYAKLDPRVQMD